MKRSSQPVRQEIPYYRRGLPVLILALLVLISTSCLAIRNEPESPPGTILPNTSESEEDSISTGNANLVNAQQAAYLAPFQDDLSDLADIPAYTIDLSVDYDSGTFQGHSLLDYTNTEDVALERLYFRLLPNGGASYGNGSLVVSNAEVDGESVESNLSLDDSVMELAIPEPVSPAARLKIEFDFNGQLSGENIDQTGNPGYGMYNATEGVTTLAGWFPMLAVYDQDGWHLDPVSSIGDSVFSDSSFYTMNISVPSEVILAATGVEVSRQSSAKTTTYQYVSGPARDFFLVMSPDFKQTSTTVDGTEINSYNLPGHEDADHQALEIAADSLKVYNERFGAYPYTELDIIEAPLRGISGVEFPGIVLIRSGYYNTPENPTFTVVIAHEVAHQWWYNLVGSDVFTDPWLDEALTSYASSLYYEFTGGRSAADGLIDYWRNGYQAALKSGQDDLVAESLAHFENLNDHSIYSDIVYSKGALFFDTLRDEIGDEAFFQALQQYYEAHKYQIAAPGDLLDQFEITASRQLDDLYQGWLYSRQDAVDDGS